MIGGKIATALADLHRQNVIHHDIKPSNIMFRASGEAVLIDFGLSHHNQLPDLMQEEFRLPYGTAPYMAPERLLGVRDDPRSDLFSLGVLLYFFTTGERPFGESETLRGMRRRLWRDPLSAAQAQGRTIRPGCRRSCCAASRSSRSGAIRRRRNWRSIWPSRPGQADRAIGAAEARSAQHGLAPPFQPRPDAAEAESRRSRRNWLRARSWRSRIDPAEGSDALNEALRVTAGASWRPCRPRGSPASTC